MADILIRGMEMPKDHSLWVCIRQDGVVKPAYGGGPLGHAVLLQPHGRCIDVDALELEIEPVDEEFDPVEIVERIRGRNSIVRHVLRAPTIIEADKDVGEGTPDSKGE